MESVQLSVPSPYELDASVLSFGFALLAPNVWQLEQNGLLGVLQRALTLEDGTHVLIRISQLRKCPGGPSDRPVTLSHLPAGLTAAHKQEVMQQVQRMLRLGDPVEEEVLSTFRRMYPPASAQEWGRLFRSPTLWEDVVKTLLLCNCGWGRTLSMCRKLCAFTPGLQPLAGPGPGVEPSASAGSPDPAALQCASAAHGTSTPAPASSRSTADNGNTRPCCTSQQQERSNEAADGAPGVSGTVGNSDVGSSTRAILAFPSPQQVLATGAARLQAECGLGYRAARLVSLAQMFAGGSVDEGELRELAHSVRVAHVTAARSLPACQGTATGAAVTLAATEPAAEAASASAADSATVGDSDQAAAASSLEQLRSRLLALPGIGPYATNNLLQVLGVYSHIPADSETARHIRQVHRVSCDVSSPKTVETAVNKVYGRYAPFSFLAYWYELWHEYQALTSTQSFVTLPPEEYAIFTGARMRSLNRGGSGSEPGPHTPEKTGGTKAASRKRKK